MEAQLRLAQSNLEQCDLKASTAGVVLELMAHAGEVGKGPVLLLGDTASMAVVAEVDQSSVAELKVGQPAEIELFGKRTTGKLARIGQLVGKNRLLSINPIDRTDLRVVEVQVVLDEPGPAAGFVNMQVEVTIVTGDGSARP